MPLAELGVKTLFELVKENKLEDLLLPRDFPGHTIGVK
jgi:hypothetical protein